MGRIDWGRVVLCGLLAGVVWGVVSAIVLPLVGRDLLVALPGFHDQPPTLPGGHHIPGTSPGFRGFMMIMPLLLGISTIWLYAAIRPRYGPGPRTAAVAGFAMWFYGSLVDAVWAALGAVPLGALVGPVAANLPVALAAAVIGAWPYKE
jgi:hypothetical protein